MNKICGQSNKKFWSSVRFCIRGVGLGVWNHNLKNQSSLKSLINISELEDKCVEKEGFCSKSSFSKSESMGLKCWTEIRNIDQLFTQDK